MTPQSRSTTQTAIRLRDTQLVILRHLAARGEMTVSQHVRTAIDEYIDRAASATGSLKSSPSTSTV